MRAASREPPRPSAEVRPPACGPLRARFKTAGAALQPVRAHRLQRVSVAARAKISFSHYSSSRQGSC
jgi:hypothetical protein